MAHTTNGSYYKWFILRMVHTTNGSYYEWFILQMVHTTNGSYYKCFLLQMTNGAKLNVRNSPHTKGQHIFCILQCWVERFGDRHLSQFGIKNVTGLLLFFLFFYCLVWPNKIRPGQNIDNIVVNMEY